MCIIDLLFPECFLMQGHMQELVLQKFLLIPTSQKVLLLPPACSYHLNSHLGGQKAFLTGRLLKNQICKFYLFAHGMRGSSFL